jgi:hypothetical protein
VLMVLGLRRARAGFSVIPFATEAGPGIPATWAEAPGREGAKDFANILPGGEMAGLYSILTTTEALKLLARALWYVEAHPVRRGALRRARAPRRGPPGAGAALAPPLPPRVAGRRERLAHEGAEG